MCSRFSSCLRCDAVIYGATPFDCVKTQLGQDQDQVGQEKDQRRTRTD